MGSEDSSTSIIRHCLHLVSYNIFNKVFNNIISKQIQPQQEIINILLKYISKHIRLNHIPFHGLMEAELSTRAHGSFSSSLPFLPVKSSAITPSTNDSRIFPSVKNVIN